jgi:Na+/melibiose symporter-like transporter
MREKPTNPPSNSQKNIKTNQNKSTCQEIGKLLCDKNFRYLFISLSCIVGFINIIATIFNSYMAMYKITDSQASYISGIANVFGIITSIIVAIIIDKTIDKTKVYTKILLYCNIISILLYIVTTIILEKVKSKSLYIIIGVLFTLIIGSAVPIYTSGMDLVCEITYPIGESTSDGVIMIGNQFLGIVGIIITALLRTFLKNIKYLSNIFCILLFSISLCCLFLLHRTDYQLKRSKQDQNENLLEGQNIFDDN